MQLLCTGSLSDLWLCCPKQVCRLHAGPPPPPHGCLLACMLCFPFFFSLFVASLSSNVAKLRERDAERGRERDSQAEPTDRATIALWSTSGTGVTLTRCPDLDQLKCPQVGVCVPPSPAPLPLLANRNSVTIYINLGLVP